MIVRSKSAIVSRAFVLAILLSACGSSPQTYACQAWCTSQMQNGQPANVTELTFQATSTADAMNKCFATEQCPQGPGDEQCSCK